MKQWLPREASLMPPVIRPGSEGLSDSKQRARLQSVLETTGYNVLRQHTTGCHMSAGQACNLMETRPRGVIITGLSYEIENIPRISAGENKGALESVNVGNPSLSKQSWASTGLGGALAGQRAVGKAGGLASVQNVCSSAFSPNSTLLKYSWPFLSELIS